MSEISLVMDVGMYDGSDTAYYLYRGFRVVAIDANPRMIESAKSRFFDPISTGRLILKNVAIAQKAGSITLYRSSRDEGSSTISLQNSKRSDENAEEVEVPCITFSNLIEEFGSPYYLKIDIEGSDRLCLEAIDPTFPPSYVSWEAGEDAIECLNLMSEKGYTRFKIIHQMNFYSVPKIYTFKYRVQRKLRKLLRFPTPLYAPHRDWTFVRGHSSGPCCEETSGHWQSLEESVHLWATFCKKSTAWFDIHAALPYSKIIR